MKGRMRYIRLLSSVSIAAVTFFAGNVYSQIERKTLAEYDFENISGTTVLDKSGNERTGTIQGDVQVVDGISGKALKFISPKDLVMVRQDDGGMTGYNELTAEVWVKYEGPQDYGYILGIWGPQSTSDDNFIMGIHSYYSSWYFEPLSRLPSGACDWEIVASGTAPLSSEWTYLVAVYNNNPETGTSVIELYENGELVKQVPGMNYPLQKITEPLRIGGIAEANWVFPGAIDEVRLLNYALDAATIKTRYQRFINSKPVADAGADQALSVIGQPVSVDGSGSSDADGDVLTYQWSFESKPAASLATLADAQSAVPSFTSDVYGEYILKLIVNDGRDNSETDFVTISFQNVKPSVTLEISEFSIFSGSAVTLNATGSDPNNDLLTYEWSVSKPEGSSAVVSGSGNSVDLLTDRAGIYTVSVKAFDGELYSDDVSATIVAVSRSSQVIDSLRAVMDRLSSANHSCFKNKNMLKPLLSKLNEVVSAVDNGNFIEAYDKLTYDIAKKTDGCSSEGAPDKNDWIICSETQSAVYGTIVKALEILQGAL